MRRWLIEKLGGFPDIDSAIEHIRATDGEQKRTILSLAVKRLFNTIGVDDILQVKGSDWLYRGRHLQKEQVKLLQAEAKALTEMWLWEVLQNELWYQANRRTFLDSRSDIDLTAGKLWMYTIDVIKTTLKKILPTE